MKHCEYSFPVVSTAASQCVRLHYSRVCPVVHLLCTLFPCELQAPNKDHLSVPSRLLLIGGPFLNAEIKDCSCLPLMLVV